LIFAGDNGDTVEAGGGADCIIGGAANDVLRGQGGNDRILGNDGDDILTGNGGDDILDGGLGADVLNAGSGTDTCTTDMSDTFVASCETVINGQDSIPPVITILGNNPIMHPVGTTYTDDGATAQDDVDGDVTSSIITTNNVIENVIGVYTVDYQVTDMAGNTAMVSRTVNVIDTSNIPAFCDDTLNYNVIDNRGQPSMTLTGTSGSDLIFAGDNGDTVEAGGGADCIIGGAANDVLRGQGGNDRILGNDGDDNLVGNSGDDILDGGLGADTLSGGSGTDTCTTDMSDTFISSCEL